MSASSMAQYGPAMNRPKSITRIPERGSLLCIAGILNQVQAYKGYKGLRQKSLGVDTPEYPGFPPCLRASVVEFPVGTRSFFRRIICVHHQLHHRINRRQRSASEHIVVIAENGKHKPLA